MLSYSHDQDDPHVLQQLCCSIEYFSTKPLSRAGALLEVQDVNLEYHGINQSITVPSSPLPLRRSKLQRIRRGSTWLLGSCVIDSGGFPLHSCNGSRSGPGYGSLESCPVSDICHLRAYHGLGFGKEKKTTAGRGGSGLVAVANGNCISLCEGCKTERH